MSEQIEVPTLPDLKITQNGKPVDTSAIDDYDSFMSFLLLASIARSNNKMSKYFEDRTSEGQTQTFDLTVTPVCEEFVCIHPSQSIHVVNDGPGQIFIGINSNKTATSLFMRDEMTIDFETHKLLSFFVWSAPGTVASARATVKF